MWSMIKYLVLYKRDRRSLHGVYPGNEHVPDFAGWKGFV